VNETMQAIRQAKERKNGATPVRGVIDLRAYATGAAPTRDWLGGRATAAFADDATVVTAIAPVGKGRVSVLPADEFLIVLAGEIAFDTTRRAAVIKAGQSAVLPAGLAFGWSAAAGTVAVIVACPGAAAALPDLVPIDEAAPLLPSNPPLAELLVGPAPSCRNHSDYRSANGEFACGTWDSTPYNRRAMLHPQVELMHFLEGAATFVDASGSVTFSKGDIIVRVRGAQCSWVSEVHVKKVYATHKPA
jgi:uncharacterized cupin superfamily protein